MGLFSDTTIPLDQKQQQLMLIQDDLNSLQSSIDQIDQEKDLAKTDYEAMQSHLPLEQRLLIRYNDLLSSIKIKDERSDEFKRVAIDSFAALPENVQQLMLAFRDKLNQNEDSQQQQQQTTSKKKQVNVTETMIDGPNYYKSTYDDYDISPFTPAALFRLLPSGSAGGKRYVTFTDALVAMSLLVKDRWMPYDPHHRHFIQPALLEQYGLDMEHAFEDYVNDPLFAGGSTHPTELPGDGYSAQWTIRFGNDNAKMALQDRREIVEKYVNLYKNYEPTTFQRKYEAPIEERRALLGQLFQRYNPDINWEQDVPETLKDQILNRFEFLRTRQPESEVPLTIKTARRGNSPIAMAQGQKDRNPKETLILAWSAMFPPDPLPNTAKAFKEYNRALGNYEQQMERVKRNLDLASQQPLSRQQFESLLRSMMNSGHFAAKEGVLARTNWIWPIAWHTLSPQVVAQAYYDALHKNADEYITLDEFDKAAQYWGHCKRFQLWYYDDLPERPKAGTKMLERVYRWASNLGVREFLPESDRVPAAYHIDMNKRFIESNALKLSPTIRQPIQLSQFHGKTYTDVKSMMSDDSKEVKK
eukprot:UN00737